MAFDENHLAPVWPDYTKIGNEYCTDLRLLRGDNYYRIKIQSESLDKLIEDVYCAQIFWQPYDLNHHNGMIPVTSKDMRSQGSEKDRLEKRYKFHLQ